MTLTAKQARFVEEYLVDLNGTQAAIRAGYSPKTAAATASRLLRKPRREFGNSVSCHCRSPSLLFGQRRRNRDARRVRRIASVRAAEGFRRTQT